MFAYVLLCTLLYFCFNFCLSKLLSKSKAKQILFIQVWLIVVGFHPLFVSLRCIHMFGSNHPLVILVFIPDLDTRITMSSRIVLKLEVLVLFPELFDCDVVAIVFDYIVQVLQKFFCVHNFLFKGLFGVG